jgi:hypothetical protein
MKNDCAMAMIVEKRLRSWQYRFLRVLHGYNALKGQLIPRLKLTDYPFPAGFDRK